MARTGEWQIGVDPEGCHQGQNEETERPATVPQRARMQMHWTRLGQWRRTGRRRPRGDGRVLLPLRTLAESTAEEGEGGTRLNGSPPQPRTAIRGPGVAERVRRLEAVIGSRGRESRRDGKVWPRRYISPRLPRPAICTVTGRGRQDSIMRLRTVWSMDSAAFGFCCRLCSTRWRSL